MKYVNRSKQEVEGSITHVDLSIIVTSNLQVSNIGIFNYHHKWGLNSQISSNIYIDSPDPGKAHGKAFLAASCGETPRVSIDNFSRPITLHANWDGASAV